MIAQADKEISRIPYGSDMLWILHGDLTGSWARHLAERISLHLMERKSGLMLDLRDIGFVDSEGAAALEHSRRNHPGLAVIGGPKDFGDIPLTVRETLYNLQPFEGIEAAVAAISSRQSTAR